MPALDDSQKATIRAALESLRRMLHCCDDCLDEDPDTDIEAYIAGLLQLLDAGKIDWESNDTAVKAMTDGDGIHLNKDFGGDYSNNYQLPPDYLLDDCKNGFFSSYWTLLEMLFHEYYHYLHHTGFSGNVGAGALVLLGWVAAIPEAILGLFGVKTSPYNGKELPTYFHTYDLLSRLFEILDDCCDCQDETGPDPLDPSTDDEEGCDCIGCCDQLLAALGQARDRQNPWP